MKVLILKEKHGERCIAVPTDEYSKGDFGRVAIKIIQERDDEGWYEGSMDHEEEAQLRLALEYGDANAAKLFFKLRLGVEYEGWDFVSLEWPLTQSLPIGCTDRYEEISLRAEPLVTTFINGNKNNVLVALENMEPRTAFAVLAEMMNHEECHRKNLHSFLKEKA